MITPTDTPQSMPLRPSRRGLMGWAVLAAVLGGLILPAGALASGFTARLYASTHRPRVGRWSLKVTATRGRQQLSGKVSYRYLFYGQVVARRSGHSFTHGVYRDTLDWPRSAVGNRITLQVVVTTRYGTDRLDWWIQVR